MSLPLIFHPAVRDEVDDAYNWYQQQKNGLGDDFLVALEEVYQRISANSQIHQIIYKDVRRGLTRRFPYGVYYRALSDRVEVLAVQHQRRNPSSWQSRR